MPFKPHVKRPRAVAVSYTPAQLAALYSFPKVTPAGPTPVIGVIELGGGYKPADMTAAFQKWGLPAPQITDVGVGGGKNAPGGDADAEVVLDIQIAAAAYSYSTGRPAAVRVYFAPNTDAGFADAVKRATLDGCAVISISWGGPEDSWSASSIAAFNAACAAAVVVGCPVLAASGDNDSGDGESGKHVDFPASSPSVVGCGGTSKTLASETVWNNGRSEGTGGGYSAGFAVPTWQSAAGVAGNARMVPDVAANADPQTGYQIVLDGTVQVVGGTSCVAPLYAGLFAAISAAKGGRLGNVLPVLWANKGAFVDIVKGNNGAYSATAGPDPCTGLGVPVGTAMLAAFVGQAPPVVPPVPPPPPPAPAPLGQLVIDLDRRTVSYPAGWATAHLVRPALGSGLLGGILSGLIASLLGAVKAKLPVIEAVVLADLANGKSFAEILADVEAAILTPVAA